MSSLSMSYNITNSYFYPLDGFRTIFYFVKNFATAAGLACPSRMAHQCLAPNAPFPLSKSFYERGKSTERYDLSVGADLRKGRESIYSKWRFGSRRYLKKINPRKRRGRERSLLLVIVDVDMKGTTHMGDVFTSKEKKNVWFYIYINTFSSPLKRRSLDAIYPNTLNFTASFPHPRHYNVIQGRYDAVFGSN